MTHRLQKMSLIPCGFTKYPIVQLWSTSQVTLFWETNCLFDQTQFKIMRKAAYRNGPKQQLYTDEGIEKIITNENIKIVTISKNRILYRVLLSELIGDSNYYYQIQLVSEELSKHRKSLARTAAELTPFKGQFYYSGEVSNQVKFGVIGSTLDGGSILARLLGGLQKSQPELLIHLGDMVSSPERRFSWQAEFFDPLYQSKLGSSTLLLPLLSPDDRIPHSSGSLYYFPPVTDKVYHQALTVGPLRIIIIDCAHYEEEQAKWVEAELSSGLSQKASFRLILISCSPFQEFGKAALSLHDIMQQRQQLLRTKLLPLLEKHHVDLVIAGGQHNYQRGFLNGIHWINSGGGGAPIHGVRIGEHRLFKVTLFKHHFLYLSVDKQDLILKAIDEHGRILDELLIPKNVVRRMRVIE